MSGMVKVEWGELNRRLGEYLWGDDDMRRSAMLWLVKDFLCGLGLMRWDYWVERRVVSWCDDDLVIWWGSSSSGKTRSAAALVLLDWIAGHWLTSSVVVSTTREMLGERIWGEVMSLWLGLKERGAVVGELVASDMVIRYRRGDTRNVLRGVAVLRGSRQEALSNLLGVHNERNVMCIDEMQGVRDVVIDALGNRMKSGRFKFLGIGNPTSRDDPLGIMSEPDGGWSNLDINKKVWRSKRGCRVEFFDGRDSPGVRDEANYGYLITKSDIERKREVFGEGSLIWWSQVIGFMPPEGVGSKLFERGEMEAMGAIGDGLLGGEVFIGDIVRVFGIDPAFSAGGDRAVLSYADIGNVMGRDGTVREVLLYYTPIILDLIGGNNGDNRTISERLCDGIEKALYGMGYVRGSRFNIAIDASGTQVAFCDMLEGRLGCELYRVNFGGSVIEGVLGGDKERYSNRSTQIWGILSEYIKCGMVRGLRDDIAVELINRRCELRGSKLALESKTEYKARYGCSPDLADSVSLIAVYARERLGVRAKKVIDKVREKMYEKEMSKVFREGGYDEREEDAMAFEAKVRDTAGWLAMAGQGYEDIIT